MGHGNSDRLYITHAEHAGGQHSSSIGARGPKLGANFARLPFDCCALTLKPFDTPVCSLDGTVFELLAIIPFLRLHGTDPVTGKKLTSSSLVKLNFFKNNDGAFHDPVTFKVFNEFTPLVAIRTSGNVYAKETVQRLNVKAGSLRDLMTDEEFIKSDIITIQDPQNVEKRDLTTFDYVKRELKITDASEGGTLSGINLAVSGVSKVLKEIAEKGKQESIPSPLLAVAKPKDAPLLASTSKSTATPYNISLVSTNRTAASFTSTALTPQTTIENSLWNEEDMMYESVAAKGDKGFVRLVTNFGNINLELFCDRAPMTCYNFLQLAREEKYTGTSFHRLIPGFMLQGGDTSGLAGRGGESCWGGNFIDEYNLKRAVKHDDRGVLSMANHGPSTNGSQFFFTFRATPHLDGKHTVFGRIVSGDDVLAKLERVPVDSTDKPLKPITIKSVAIFGDPFEVYKDKLGKRLAKEEEARDGAGMKARKREENKKDRTTWMGTTLAPTASSTAAKASIQKASGAIDAPVGVGKYMKREAEKVSESSGGKKRKGNTGFGSFDSW